MSGSLKITRLLSHPSFTMVRNFEPLVPLSSHHPKSVNLIIALVTRLN
ncbi:hypothetical protein N9073_05600 [Akkermansiaceae bacterium]|nr:hypothetical protein [Akkermansiaceae bacterium]